MTAGPHSRRIEGPTPNGGAYAIGYFRDASGAACPRLRAVAVETVEFDASGRAIARTYAALTPRPRSAAAAYLGADLG